MNTPGLEPIAEVERDGVAVRLVDGRPTFWPVSFDRLDPDTRELAELVADWVTERRELAVRIDATVPTLRESGMSWGQVGWLVGMTSEGARQRWGGDNG
jgi:hypothetical protein